MTSINQDIDSILKKDRIMASILAASVVAGFLHANGTFESLERHFKIETDTSSTSEVIPLKLKSYFGASESIKILVSPEDTRRILAKEEFSPQRNEFKGVLSNYLIQLENGETYGFNPYSNLVYGETAIDVESAIKPFEKLNLIRKAVANIEETSKILGGAKKAVKTQDISSEEAVDAPKDIAKTQKTQKATETKKVSEEELQALIQSKFDKGTFTKKDEAPQKSESLQDKSESTSTDDKLDDIEKLRMELKARVQKEFGDIPNANATINQHFGNNSSNSMGNRNSRQTSVSDNQVNVQAIRETKNAVFYKNERIPKIGYDLDGNKISEKQKQAQVQGIMSRIIQMDDYWSVVYRAKGEEKKKIAVFSDPTCPYCKKLHEVVPELQEAGVTVYHLFYNRSMAPNTVNEPKVIQVNEALKNAWCSVNPNEAIDSLYEGYAIPETDCSDVEGKIDFPGNEHYLMGRIIDMSGTPYTITEDGRVIAGFSIRGVSQPQAFLRDIGL